MTVYSNIHIIYQIDINHEIYENPITINSSKCSKYKELVEKVRYKYYLNKSSNIYKNLKMLKKGSMNNKYIFNEFLVKIR